MKKIVALIGDYYHPKEWVKASLNQALTLLKSTEEVEWIEIQPEDLISELETEPDAVILYKENRLNPTDEKINHWMTEEIETAITEYVNRGGGWLAWHSGLASYPVEGDYIQMLKGYFEYHPVPHPIVKYSHVTGTNNFGTPSFKIKDEHYFVKVDEKQTHVFLTSDSDEGHSSAGWFHSYGQGRVCCIAPAHNLEGLMNQDLTHLLFKTIEWVVS